MKRLLQFALGLSMSAALFVGCGDDDGQLTTDPYLTLTPTSESTGFRGETVTLELAISTSEPLTSATANGTSLNPSVDLVQTLTYDFTFPSDDPVGTQYEVQFSAASPSESNTQTQVLTLVSGPGLEEPDLEPLATVFGEFSQIEITTLLSSTDVLDTYSSVGGFQLGGSADGAGMVVNPVTGNFELLVNCEDHYSVARITLDQNLKPLKGDYLLNSSVADLARQCSGTMWEAEIHGGSQDLFISSSESFSYQSRGIPPFLDVPTPNANYNLPALGEFSWENNVPLPQNAFPGKTVIVGGDDDSSDSEGQVALYMSENGDADLSGGSIYVLRRVGATTNETEADLEFGVTYDVEFIEIPNGSSLTKSEMEQASIDALSLQFMRVEDLDYGKGSDAAGRIVYFAVTGRGPGRGTYNDWGTGYKLALDDTDPLKGELTQIVSGNTAGSNKADGNLSLLQSPDNICVTENYIYWQEDPNSFDRNHQAYIWQTDLDGNGAAAVLQIDINQSLNRDGDDFSGEFGAMFDISDKVGENGTFILALQPHYWEDAVYEGIDGHVNDAGPDGSREDDQGSQLVILRNVPR